MLRNDREMGGKLGKHVHTATAMDVTGNGVFLYGPCLDVISKGKSQFCTRLE
jgi:hypothetical protein